MDAKKKNLRKNMGMAYWMVLVTSIALLVAGFLVPPMGVIDGSVLIGVGMLLLFTCAYIAITGRISTTVAVDLDDKKIELTTKEDDRD